MTNDALRTTPQPGVEKLRFLDHPIGIFVTILLLTVGPYAVPILGWVAGAVLLWRSRIFTFVDKVVMTALSPAAIIIFLGLRLIPFAAPVTHCTGTGFCAPVAPQSDLQSASTFALFAVGASIILIAYAIVRLASHRRARTRAH